MKKLLVMLLAAAFALSFVSCGGSDNNVVTDFDRAKAEEDTVKEIEIEPDTVESMVEEVEEEEEETSLEELPPPSMINADFQVAVNPDVSFIITTNLPDETELMLKLSGRGYLAQGKARVEDGMAISERFTDGGEQLYGEFTLEVMMPIPSVQSDYVRHFIGERGEFLTGPNLSGALGSVVVKKEFDFSVYPEGMGEENTLDTSSKNEDRLPDGNYYRTPYGERYHTDPDCGGKNSYITEDIEGLTPCEKCVDFNIPH